MLHRMALDVPGMASRKVKITNKVDMTIASSLVGFHMIYQILINWAFLTMAFNELLTVTWSLDCSADGFHHEIPMY